MTEQSTTPAPPEPKGKPFYLKPKFIMSAIAAVFFLILIFQNWDSTTIDIFFWKTNAPAALLYLIFSLIGFVVGYLLAHARAKHKKK